MLLPVILMKIPMRKIPDEEDSDDEEDDEESGSAGGAAAGFSAEQLEKLKDEALGKFAVIGAHFKEMQQSFEKDGYNSPAYLQAHESISAELLTMRFTARFIEKLCVPCVRRWTKFARSNVKY